MPINFIQGLSDPRLQVWDQSGAKAGQALGQAHSGKTLKSMFQDVIDAGGDVQSAMRKILPFDPELSEKLGMAEMKKQGDSTIKRYILEANPELANKLGDNLDKVDAPTLFSINEIETKKAQQAQQQLMAEKQFELSRLTQALEAADREEKIALERDRLAETKRSNLAEEDIKRGGNRSVVTLNDGVWVVDRQKTKLFRLGDRPVSEGSLSNKERLASDLRNEHQILTRQIASITSGAGILDKQFMQSFVDSQTGEVMESPRDAAVGFLESERQRIARRWKELGNDPRDLGIYEEDIPTSGDAYEKDYIQESGLPDPVKDKGRSAKFKGRMITSDGIGWYYVGNK